MTYFGNETDRNQTHKKREEIILFPFNDLPENAVLHNMKLDTPVASASCTC